ncbi:hypothetical protein SCG7086_AF_00060 [Chlamydiales bacterium SCGC AG-110-P3]|nr:hypothetical protein SCG7086_AF_00060 [Chlamydiales bacterium SCGC AG-110-P3]
MTDKKQLAGRSPVQRLCAEGATLPWVAAALAHRIRNPLAGASATLQLLRSRLTDDAHCVSLDTVERELNRVALAVTHFLDVTGAPLTAPTSCRMENIDFIGTVLPPTVTVAGAQNVLNGVFSTLKSMAKETELVAFLDDSSTQLTIHFGHDGSAILSPAIVSDEETADGLAVSACRATLRSLGGELVSSRHEKNWRFTATLPCGMAVEGDQAAMNRFL